MDHNKILHLPRKNLTILKSKTISNLNIDCKSQISKLFFSKQKILKSFKVEVQIGKQVQSSSDELMSSNGIQKSWHDIDSSNL